MRIISLLLAACCASAVHAADNYPSRPVRVIVPYTAGGSADVFARAVGQKLSEAWGQQIVVDNRPGAGGVLGTETAASAPRDGYTLMMGNTANIAINPALYKKMSVDTQRDFIPITLVATAPYVMVAPVSLNVASPKEFIALAKTKPGQLNYASLGNGSASHLSAELLQTMAGIKLTHVPYKTLGTVLPDLIAGQVQVFFLGMVSAQSQIKGGRLRAIGVTGPKRSPALPDVPAVAEAVPGFDVVSWYGMFAPAGTPHAIVTRVNADTKRVLESPEMRDRLSSEGADVATSTPEAFAAYIKTEMTKWSRVVKLSGAHAD